MPKSYLKTIDGYECNVVWKVCFEICWLNMIIIRIGPLQLHFTYGNILISSCSLLNTHHI
jgi:hypothetical protein